MYKRTLIRRSLLTGLAITAATFPAAVQARVEAGSPDPSGNSPAPVVNPPAPQQSSTSAQSQFDWGDAGIGAAGAVFLIGIGSGTAVAVRRRSGALAG